MEKDARYAASTIHQYLSHGVKFYVHNLNDLAKMFKALAKRYPGKMPISKVFKRQSYLGSE